MYKDYERKREEKEEKPAGNIFEEILRRSNQWVAELFNRGNKTL